MEILSSLLDLSITVFAVAGMLSVGLRYTVAELVGPLRDTGAVIRALAANFVLVPLLAVALVRLFPLDPPFQSGLVVLGVAAGAPSLLKLAQIAGCHVATSATLLILLLPVTIVSMPVAIPLAMPGAAIGAGAIARPLVLNMLLPLALGLAVRAWRRDRAARLQPVMGRIANAALGLLLALTVIVNSRRVLGVFGEGVILASVLFIAGAFATGYLLGGRDRADRVVLGLGTGQRNIAAAMVVARQTFEDPRILAMVVVVSTLTLLLFPLAGALGRAGRREERRPRPLAMSAAERLHTRTPGGAPLMARPLRQTRLPAGPSEVIASYETYDDAQRAIDFAADRRFPVERLAIVAGDLRFVERVTGRLGYGTAAANGAASGALTGAFLGFILGLFSLITPLTSGLGLAFYGLVIGAVIGAIVGVLGHALSGGRRDFSSVAGLDAGRYDVVAASDVAEQARHLLSELPLRKIA